MITYLQGNLLESRCEAIVIPVNCVGVMGAGLALAYKEFDPSGFAAYKAMCDTHQLKLSNPVFYHGNKTAVFFFPTKDHWKDDSRLEDIRAGLIKLDTMIESAGIYTVGMPFLGAGLGKIPRAVVAEQLNSVFDRATSYTVLVYTL